MIAIPETVAARLALAKGYPFPAPAHSYLFVEGEPVPVATTGRTLPTASDLSADGRMPVLGYGSNRSPQQLARKFPEPGQVIPVIAGWLNGFDVVYSAHLTRYGSLPAALIPVPGTRVAVSVLWLDADQLARMHETESIGRNYAFARLERVSLTLDGGSVLNTVCSYEGKAGALLDSGRPMALSAVAATGRRWPAFDQEAAIARLRDRLEPAADLDTFILGHIDDPRVRCERRRRMQAESRLFAYEHMTVIEGG